MKTILILTLLCFSLCEYERKTFEKFYEVLKSQKMKIISVAGADNEEILKTLRKAKDTKIADSILVGNEKRIREMASRLNIDISDFKLINKESDKETASTAVKIVHDGKADLFMKGSIQTKDALLAVLDKNIGLRTGNPLSLVGVYDIEGQSRMLFITDPAIMPYPTLQDKVKLINNAKEVTYACGIDNPKVAVLAAVEVINPKMKATVEAAELTKMNERGEITGCIVDGPLSMDLAIDPEAAHFKKSTNRKIQGDANILLFPDITSGNSAYKIFSHVSKSRSGNIVVGTSAPFILTSRSDTEDVKYNSIALACLYAEYLKNKKK